MDHQIGLLLARLRRTGLFDQALLVVTADHGYAFEVGVKDRRLVTDRNVDEIAPVPMFVKAPGQTDGRDEPEPDAQPRRDAHDRRPARRPDRLAPRRALGVRALHPAAHRGGAPHA